MVHSTVPHYVLINLNDHHGVLNLQSWLLEIKNKLDEYDLFTNKSHLWLDCPNIETNLQELEWLYYCSKFHFIQNWLLSPPIF